MKLGNLEKIQGFAIQIADTYYLKCTGIQATPTDIILSWSGMTAYGHITVYTSLGRRIEPLTGGFEVIVEFAKANWQHRGSFWMSPDDIRDIKTFCHRLIKYLTPHFETIP
jgi:hypothetical protein